MSYDTQDIIEDHLNNPRRKWVMDSPLVTAQKVNPLCGDVTTIYLGKDVATERYTISFQGTGCVLSKVSGSIMCELCNDKSKEELLKIIEDVPLLLKANSDDVAAALTGDLQCFNDIWRFPTRKGCVLLPWTALEENLLQIGIKR